MKSGACVVTASERPAPGGGKQLVDQALDLFFYAPVGLIVSSLEELTPDHFPELAEKGRGRIGRLLSNARVVGQLTVAMGRRSFGSEVSRWIPPTEPEWGTASEPAPPPLRLRSQPEPAPEPQRRTSETDLAIPGYEALSASQVVRRLDGLGPSELEAIYEHEAATRRRRTILHRTQQLLGHEDAPGPAEPKRAISNAAASSWPKRGLRWPANAVRPCWWRGRPSRQPSRQVPSLRDGTPTRTARCSSARSARRWSESPSAP